MSKLSTNRVSGFIVVRKAPLNRDHQGRGAFSDIAPCLRELCYAGIDRMPWFELDELFYQGLLPENMQEKCKKIQESNRDLPSIRICNDLYASIELLNYSNSLNAENELIAIRSEKLSIFKGTVEFDRSLAEWLGYDVVALAEWSLLKEGLYSVPLAFPGWVEQLNENGLISSKDKALEFGTTYLDVSRRGEVEELSDELFTLGFGIDAIEIGRVLLQ